MRTRRLRLIAELQQQIRNTSQPIALRYAKGQSNTTRSKAYKKECRSLSCAGLDQVLDIDAEHKRVHTGPRVTMEALVKATLPYGLMPPVVPEFKGITVGGAIMGAAAESTSHRWGIFHDTCTELELIDGQGNLIKASPVENPPLFYGISGSYGSLGMLVGAELQLIPVKPTVLLRYYPFQDPHEALHKIVALTGQVDFLDGMIFSPNHTVVVTGEMVADPCGTLPSKWFAHHVADIKNYQEECMPIYQYLFRYDEGAFWMGSYLFNVPFLHRYLKQGLLGIKGPLPYFDPAEATLFNNLSFPGKISRTLARPLMNSQRLWGLLHKADKWIQDRLVIQDCSIPTLQAHAFLDFILKDPGLFPIWLCPLKGTSTPQYFAPHHGCSSVLNFGLYGTAAYSAPMSQIISTLESLTHNCGGKKVLYSRSYYTEEAFWKIYPKTIYESLREQMHAHGKWRGITEKVLSE